MEEHGKTERLFTSGVDVAIAELEGDAFPSGIDIAYQRRNRNRHARREADTRARIQRRRKFMPVPCRRRQAYDVPSTVSRGVLAPISLFVSLPRPSLSSSLTSSLPSSHPSASFPISILPSPLVRSSARSLARASERADHSSQSASGEPLSKSYAIRRRSSVDYFSKSSGSRIFKWRLNETGSFLFLLFDSLQSLPQRCERLFAFARSSGSRLDPLERRVPHDSSFFVALFTSAHRPPM